MRKESLARYQKKRDFSRTAEPSGHGAVSPSNRLRFVIQKHAASHLHYDLRLELDGVFKSWAVTKGRSINPADKRLRGAWVLVRMKGNRFGGKRTNWLLIKHRDSSARPGEAQALLDLDRCLRRDREVPRGS
jgi:hypothetical protein